MIVRLLHEGVVKIREIAICDYNDIIEIYVDFVNQKYPKVSYSTTCSYRCYHFTLQIESQSGRGRWTMIDLIPQGRREHRLFRNGRLVPMWTRYATCWRLVPNPDRRFKHRTVYFNREYE